MEIQIKPLSEEYVDGVCLLEEEVFSMPWHRESFLEMIENKDARYLVAFIDNKVAGSCGLRNILGEGEITNVVTAPAFRRQHVAHALLTKLLAEGEEMGVKSFTLEVRVSNAPAIALYEKLGFVAEGIRPGFYDRPKEDALIMWKR